MGPRGFTAISGSTIAALGPWCYRYRQYFSMALLAASIAMARPWTRDASGSLLVDALAFALVLAGGALRSWAMGYHVWRRVRGAASDRTLVTAGPYALVRNPLYLGTLLISAGVALMSGSAIIVATYLVVFWLGYYIIIFWEEQRLTSQFAEAYGEYLASVPRLIPALKRWSRPEGAFSLPTMMRCMEPLKTLGFVAVLCLLAWLRTGRVLPE